MIAGTVSFARDRVELPTFVAFLLNDFKAWVGGIAKHKQLGSLCPERTEPHTKVVSMWTEELHWEFPLPQGVD